jgi:hypothetical protein
MRRKAWPAEMLFTYWMFAAGTRAAMKNSRTACTTACLILVSFVPPNR